MIKSFLILIVVFSSCAVFAKPSLVVTPESHDFGTVIRGVTVSHVYQIENRGTEPIEILLVKTSCGCSASVLREKIIPPGASVPLLVNFDSTEFFGGIRKSVTIYSTDPERKEHSVRFRADVTSHIQVSPEVINLRKVQLGEHTSIHFQVTIEEGSLTDITVNEQFFSVSCDRGQTDGYECQLSVRDNAPSGSILENMILHTDLADQPSYLLKIYGRIEGAFDVVPGLIDFGVLASEDTVSEVITLSSVDGEPFAIKTVTLDNSSLAYQISGSDTDVSHEIEISFAPAQLIDVVEGKISIMTDRADNPEIQIKYQAYVE